MIKLGKFLIGMMVATVAQRKLSENGGLACVFGHKWNGCTCEKCGTVRDEHHRMVSVPGECAKQCAICGKTERIKHKYKKDPDTGDYICAVCGVNKESECSEDQKIFIVFGVVIGICVLLMLIGWMWEHPILAIALIALIILCGITAMLLRHLRLVRQQDIDILNADVSKIGDDEATRRAEKYQDK